MKKFLAAFSLLTFSFSALPLQANTSEKNEPKAIRVAPAAPKFTDAERQTELAARRARVLERMSDNSMMILMSGEPRITRAT